ATFSVSLALFRSLEMVRSFSMMVTPSGRPVNFNATASLNFSRVMSTLIVAVSPCLMLVSAGAFTLIFLPPSPSPVFLSLEVQPVPPTSRTTVNKPVVTNENHFIEESSRILPGQKNGRLVFLLHLRDTHLTLFRGLAVKVFVVRLCLVTGVVDDAVPMIRRRIERIELQWNSAGLYDVVIRPSRNDDCEARADRRSNALENRLAGPFLHAKKLVERVNLRSDLFPGL